MAEKHNIQYTGTELDAILAKANVSISKAELDNLLVNAGGNVALFQVDYAKATKTTSGSTSSTVTKNDTCFFDLGFTPKAAIIFTTHTESEDTGSSYVRERTYWYLNFSYQRFYEYSNYDNENDEDYGGIAFTGSPAIGLATKMQVAECVTNGVNIMNYYYYYEDSDGGDHYKIINCSGSYCLAIG